MELVKEEKKEVEKELPIKRKKIRLNVKRLKGRKVILRRYSMPEVGNAEYEDFYAKFVEWGNSYNTDEAGGFIKVSTALCIDEYGVVYNVPAQFVRFV